MRRLSVLTVLVLLALAPGTAGAGEAVPECRGNLATVVIALGQEPTPGRDVIVGTDDADEIHGLGGNDVICGRGGPDHITGDGGGDSVFGGAGHDWLHGGRQNDVVADGPGNDTLIGGAGDADQCRAGNGVERISPSCEIVSIP